MNIAFEEKSVWVQFLALIFILGGYFLTAAQMVRAGVDHLAAYAPVFAVSVVMLVVVLIAGHIVAAATSRSEQRDERDKIIAWRAESLSSWVMGVGIIMAITAMVVGVSSVWVAHGLLLALLLSELGCLMLRIFFYRRGI
ncbi:MAG: hypothetical protein AAAFM81_12790 [Pseudomonadota bacterium]